MRHIYALSAALLLACADAPSPVTDGDGEVAITAGRTSQPAAYPWFVQVLSYRQGTWQAGCGGSLISPWHVVTAAHCVIDDAAAPMWHQQTATAAKPEYRRIVVRPTALSAMRLQDHQLVRRLWVHPQFSVDSKAWDMAVLELARPVRLARYATLADETVVPSVIAQQGFARALGHGRTETGRKSNVLLETDLPLVATETCQPAFPFDALASSMVCAGYPNWPNGACNGDSGGPLMLPGGDWLLGVTSFGGVCGRTHSIFADVTKASAWIKACMTGTCEQFAGETRCADLYGNCDGVASNGCETYVVQAGRCGACAAVCPVGLSCVAGTWADDVVAMCR